MTAADEASASALLALLDADEPRARLRAARALSPTGTARFALRAALLGDEDARVRATAASRLRAAAKADDQVAGWLWLALEDPALLVRAAAARGLGRWPEVGRELLRAEPAWRVRRAAVRGLGATRSAPAVEALRFALEDPFWRVRDAALRGLSRLRRDPLLAEAVEAPLPEGASARARDAHAHLLGGSAPASTRAAPPQHAWIDVDPAVAVARLRPLPPESLDPVDLAAHLGASHGSLRALVVRRLARLGRARGAARERALQAVLAWLEEPRAGRAVAAARVVLARLTSGRPAVEAALRAGRPGGLAWACGWIAAQDDADLRPRLVELAGHADPAVRRAAASALLAPHEAEPAGAEGAALERALDDEDPRVRAIAAARLAARRPGALAGRPLPAAVRGDSDRAIAAALLAAADRRGDAALLEAGAGHPDGATRAEALARLLRSGLSPALRAAAEADPDPWVRAATLTIAGARRALLADPDPGVRRAAAAHLLRGRRAPELAGELDALARAFAASGDAWVRARAPRWLDRTPGALPLLLDLSSDASPAVRAAAADLLEGWPGLAELLDDRLAGQTLSDAGRRAAWTWRTSLDPDGAAGRLRVALEAGTEPLAVVEHLRGLSLLFDAALDQPAPGPRSSGASVPAEVARRPLGRTGFALAPLVLSGVHELPPREYARAAAAGVDAFFWEPRHIGLTAFLRRPARRALRVVTGTFHGDPEGIRRDLDRARRRLRRETIDVFLLFWARSPGRLGEEAVATLEAARRDGALRAFGFSTHDRGLAAAALSREPCPWDVVMLRHSAAHPGIEEEVLPIARARGVGVLTFSALAYGQLLRPHGAGAPPTAADCYRYGLAQPGVAACVSAPRHRRELLENLAVLGRPELEPTALAALRAHGALVHAESRRFQALVRGGDEERVAEEALARAREAT